MLLKFSILAVLLSTVFCADTFKNPLLSVGPDPWVLKHKDHYYMTHTTGGSVVLYKTQEMSQLHSVKPVTVWTPPSSGPHSKEIWAPEIHFMDGKFYVYFAADDGNNNNHRIYCIENSAEDPTTGKWELKGKVHDTHDKWAIDATVFTFKNHSYMAWSGWEGDVNGRQSIYIAKLSNPWTISGSRAMISTPDHAWEKFGSPQMPFVNEGPEALISPQGRLFLTFSASHCSTDNYVLGLLTLKEGGDPMNPVDWKKTGKPVFSKAAEAYGPGHNGFFKSPDGKEDWLIYHANPQPGQGCGNHRSPRMQKFTWNSDGTPNFGSPIALDKEIKKPSGEK